MIETPAIPDARHLCHHAMRTTFSLRFPGLDTPSARGLARECFDRIDEIESRLSRFIEGSDISRINSLAAGETLHISEDCHRCLLLALDGHRLTGGRFDISIGREIRARKNSETAPLSRDGQLVIHPDTAAVTCLAPGRELDLGGIGKGFALDVLAELIAEWDVADALLCAGASSMLAIGPTAWPISLQGDSGKFPLTLQNLALSASGLGIQGDHIVAPPGIDLIPGPTPNRVWVTAQTATWAEILSTAMMLTPREVIVSRKSQFPRHSDSDLSLAGPLGQRSLPAVYLDTPDGITGPWDARGV